MTAPLLLTYICAALLLQVISGVAVAILRRRRSGADTEIATRGGAPPSSVTPWSGWRDFRVARREFEDSARTQCSFYLAPADGVPLQPFKPGQFLTFALPVSPERTITRCYSLSDKPDPTQYRVTIKRILAPRGHPEVPAGASSNFFHDRVHQGDVLKVKAPAGHFFIDADEEVPAVLIAGGIGITPMMSMLRWCLREQPERTIHLYYGLRNSEEHAFKQALEELARDHSRFHLNIVYSQPRAKDVPGRDYHFAGHVEVDFLRRTLPHGRHHFYVCGPASMMQQLIPALAEWGVPEQDIHYEAFGAASVHAAQVPKQVSGDTAPVRFEVQFRRSGRTLIWDGRDENLLEFAERSGVAVDSACRAGSCGTCETRLVSGAVQYAHEPDHDVRAGYCLLCVGAPKTALILDA